MSDIVRVNASNELMCRSKPLSDEEIRRVIPRSVYARKLAKDLSLEMTKALFSEFGRVVAVQRFHKADNQFSVRSAKISPLTGKSKSGILQIRRGQNLR